MWTGPYHSFSVASLDLGQNELSLFFPLPLPPSLLDATASATAAAAAAAMFAI